MHAFQSACTPTDSHNGNVVPVPNAESLTPSSFSAVTLTLDGVSRYTRVSIIIIPEEFCEIHLHKFSHERCFCYYIAKRWLHEF